MNDYAKSMASSYDAVDDNDAVMPMCKHIPNMYRLSDKAVKALVELYLYAMDDTGRKVIEFALNDLRYTSNNVAQINYDCMWRTFNGVVLGNHIQQPSKAWIAVQCKNPGFADDFTLLQYAMQEWRQASLSNQIIAMLVAEKMDKYYGN